MASQQLLCCLALHQSVLPARCSAAVALVMAVQEPGCDLHRVPACLGPHRSCWPRANHEVLQSL